VHIISCYIENIEVNKHMYPQDARPNILNNRLWFNGEHTE